MHLGWTCILCDNKNDRGADRTFTSITSVTLTEQIKYEVGSHMSIYLKYMILVRAYSSILKVVYVQST